MNPAKLLQQKMKVLIKKLGKSTNFKNPSYKKLRQASDSSKKVLPIPQGYMDVYVGEEERRYQIPLRYLSCATFQELIVEYLPAVFDPKIEEPIVLGCSTEFFDQFLNKMADY